jgi:hypothetical protein
MLITYELLFVGLLFRSALTASGTLETMGTLGIRVSMLLEEGFSWYSGKQYFGIRAFNLWEDEARHGA